MPRILERALSPTFVKTAPPGMHCDGRGLYLQVTVGKDGKLNRSWIFRYRVNGRSRDMGLGALATIGLSEARERAKARRQERLDKIDPLEARKSARAAEEVDKAKTITFDEAAGAYIEAHEAGWRNAKHASQWRNTILTYASPVLGALPVRAIDTGLVLKVIEPLWSTRRETASRLRGRIEAILDWARVRGYRESENPARWKGHLAEVLPARAKVREVIHLAAMPYVAVPGFVAALREQEGIGCAGARICRPDGYQDRGGSRCAMARDRRRRSAVDGAGEPDQAPARAPRAAEQSRPGCARACGYGPRERIRLRRRAGRRAAVAHGAADSASPHGDRVHGARLPIELSRLGRGAHELPARDRRGRARPRHRR